MHLPRPGRNGYITSITSGAENLTCSNLRFEVITTRDSPYEFTMVRVDTPIHSDDEFDLVYDAESSSNNTDLQVDSYTSHYATNVQPSEPHEISAVPNLPYPHQGDSSAAATQQPSSHVLEDATRSKTDPSSPWSHGPSSNKAKAKGNLVNDGLQYTKSVYNKFMSKDALIAVMG